MVKPVFLYLKSCKLSDRSLKKLNAQGYVTIGVESFDDVKIVDPILVGSTQLAKEAYETIIHSLHGSTREAFGERVAKCLTAKLI